MSQLAVAGSQLPVTACPRCARPLIRNHDVVECLVHGTIAEPVRAWDLPSDEDPESKPGNARRQKTFGTAGPAWTEEERREWEQWQEGDPVPSWAAGNEREEQAMEPKPTQPLGQVVQIESAEQLARGCEGRITVIDSELARLDAAMRKLQDERKKLAAVVALLRGTAAAKKARVVGVRDLGGPVTCDACGQDFANLQAVGTHKARKHGPGWSTGGNFAKKPEAVA